MRKIPSILQKIMDENKLMAIELPVNPMYEVGKRYWSGYWSRQYTVLEVNTETHGENVFLKSVTVQEENGQIHTHGTWLDPLHDWEVRGLEQTMAKPPLVGQITFHYHYGKEVINCTDPEKLLSNLKEGLNTLGPNGVSVKLFSDDLDLHYQVFAQEAGEYGYDVDKERYFSLAKQYGLYAPELKESIMEKPIMEVGPSEEDQLRDMVKKMEQGRAGGEASIGKITLHRIDEEINYDSKEKLQQDYLDAIKQFGAGSISATLFVEDHELSFKLDEIEAKDLGFNIDKDMYMKLVATYGQGSPQLSQATSDTGWDGPDWEQDMGEPEL